MFTGVCLSIGGVPGPGGGSGPRGVPGPEGCAWSNGYCCRWYVSYWNAFLFLLSLTSKISDIR